MTLGVEDSHVEHAPLPGRAATVPDAPLRYIVNKNCGLSVNGVTVPFKSGTVVDSAPMIARLLESRADISPITDETDLGTCPHCGRSFSLGAQGGARRLLERARQLMPGFR